MKKIVLFALAALFLNLSTAQAACPSNQPGCSTYTNGGNATAILKSLNVYSVPDSGPNGLIPIFNQDEAVAAGIPECVSWNGSVAEGVQSTCITYIMRNAWFETDAKADTAVTNASTAASAAATAQAAATAAAATATSLSGTAQDALAAANNKSSLYVDGVLKNSAREITVSALTSGTTGTATFALTDGSNNALCPNAVFKKTANFWVDDNSLASPSFGGYSVSGDRKTLQITVKRPSGTFISLLNLTLLGSGTSAVPANTEVNLRIMCN
ncbi:MAG: hypothetical protein AB7H77_11970 [Bdellovibrionales bacterium]